VVGGGSRVVTVVSGAGRVVVEVAGSEAAVDDVLAAFADGQARTTGGRNEARELAAQPVKMVTRARIATATVSAGDAASNKRVLMPRL
jgi:hypothetical protein